MAVLDLHRLREVPGRRRAVAAAHGDLAGQGLGGEQEHVLRLEEPGERALRRHAAPDGLELGQLARGVLWPAGGGEGHTARVAPHAGDVRHSRGRRRLAQDLVPATEAGQRQERRRRGRLHVRHLQDHRGGGGRRELARGAHGLGASPLHARGLPDEVEVVRVIHHAVDVARLRLGEVRAVCLHRLHVGRPRVRVPADPVVDVRRHVDHVPRAGRERAQTIGGGEGALRCGAPLHRVDIEMVGARVIRVCREHPLERDDDLLGAGLGLAVLRPQGPRAQVHHRVGEERRRVEVVGKAPRDVAHGVGIGAVEGGAVGVRRATVARGERGNDGALALRGPRRQRARLHDGRERGVLALRVGRAIVVRAIGEGHAPVAHGARRIEAGRLAEGPLCLEVIEAVDQPQSLVEVGLGLRRRGRDLLLVRPEVRVQRRRRLVRARRVLMRDRRRGRLRRTGRPEQCDDDRQREQPSVHAAFSSISAG